MARKSEKTKPETRDAQEEGFGKKKASDSKAKLYNEIIAAIDGLNPMLPPFGETFHVTEPQPGVRLLLRESGSQVVSLVSDDALAGAILRYCNYRVGSVRFMVTMTQAREVAKMWMHSLTPIAEPRPVAALSGPCLTFHRLPFDPSEDGDCPVFLEFLGRCTNAKALMAFIGSLFDPEADRQQYVWLHGGGNNGKGSVMRLLSRLLGPAYHSEMVPDAKRGVNQFWTASFLGKRLVVFPDCNSPQFPQSGLFKSLTGGDAVRIEQKNKSAFSTELACKFLFASNEKLILSSGESDIRRTIYCHVGSISGKVDPDYEQKLWDEAPQILALCQMTYWELAGPRTRIPVEGDLDDLTDLHDARYEELFHQYFEQTQDGNLPKDNREFVTPVELAGILRDAGMTNPRDQNKCIDYWERIYGVEKYRPGAADGSRPGRRYIGMRRKQVNLVPMFGSLAKQRRGPQEDQR